MPDSETSKIVIQPERPFSMNFGELWQYRELFYFFTWREVKVKYKQTLLGVVWIVLQPLLMMLIFSYLISRMANISGDGLEYPVFTLSGLIFWSFFASSISNAGTSMISNASIIQKVFFPRIIIPTSAVFSSIIDFGVSTGLFLVVLVIYKPTIDWGLLVMLWPLAYFMVILASMGVSILLSALTIKYRDFRFVVPFILQIGFFVTPIWYSSGLLLDETMRSILAINPVSGAILLFRIPLGIHTYSINEIYISAASTLFFLILGLYYFKRTESYFADLA